MATSVELFHPDLPELIDALLKVWRKSWAQLEAGLKVGDELLTLDDLQWMLIDLDPVLWGECNLVNRPEDGGGLWRFFDYQKPSLRLDRHVVHQDGAEVGKTREIVTLALWSCLGGHRGSVLVGSALDGDLDEIWDEIQFQLAGNPFIAGKAQKQTTKPYRRITWDNGLKTLFRPAGFDGRAFRGVHVGGFALHDEAAKVENSLSWTEFWRAGKPGCRFRLYSVPTGRRDITFQELADRALPFNPPPTTPEDIVARLFRHRENRGAQKDLSRESGSRRFVRVHWPKTIMPAPFWGPEREAEYLELYGSRDAPGYVHNVLGLPGDPEHSVFPWKLLSPCLRSLPEYVTATLRWDSATGMLEAKADRLNPLYTVQRDEAAVLDDEEPVSDSLAPFLPIWKETLDVSDFESLAPQEKSRLVADLLSTFLVRPGGRLAGGIDVGSSSTTAVTLFRDVGSARQWLLRLRLIGFGWHALRDSVHALDDLYNPEIGWGLDGTGVGATLADLLRGDDLTRGLADRLSPFVFNQSVEVLSPETGEPLVDEHTGRAISLPYKEWATQLLEREASARTLHLPPDPDLLQALQDHTYQVQGEGRRTYRKVNDHDVDAARVAELRIVTARFPKKVSPPVSYASVSGPQGRLESLSWLEGR